MTEFPDGVNPSPNPDENIELVRGNNRNVRPRWTRFPNEGRKALTGFMGAAFNTTRNWQDNTLLTFPGSRDRIVRVRQTDKEGGTNLSMSPEIVECLAARGQHAASQLHLQFVTAQTDYQGWTGWENHQWVRYRRLLATLPDWFTATSRGATLLSALDAAPQRPSYQLGGTAAILASQLRTVLINGADAVDTAPEPARRELTAKPNPAGTLRIVPDL